MKEINNIFEVAQSCSYADDSNAGCVEGNVDGLSTLLSMYFDLPDLNACLGGKGILHCLPAMVMIASHLHMKGVPSCNSFAGDTMVLMADGTSKPIDNVKVGDKIKNALPGAPPGTRDQTHTVTAIHVTHTDHNYTDITIATPNGTRTITGTSHHLYWDATSRAWTQADELHPGDHLQAADARTATILATRTYTATMVTYNLTVDGVHTYYVEAGATPVLVHNSLCGPVENSKPEELTMDMFEAELRGVVPVTASDAAKSGGDYLWAVGKDGSLNLVPALDGIFHTVATGGDSVVAAGQVTFRDGVVASFDNFTGHYTPCPQCAATFIERGVNAFASQGIRVPYSTIVDYGGRTP